MPEADPKIIKQLKLCADQGLSFYQARQKLVSQGYQEEAIELAGDQYEYGTKPAAPDEATAAYEKDPKDAALAAKDILKEQKRDREEQAIVDGIAGQSSPDIQSDVKYQNNYLRDIGLSWWVWLIINAAIVGVILWFNLPRILCSIVIIVLIVVLAIKRA